MICNLSNKTASEKNSNGRFREYLGYTNTKYEVKSNSDVMCLDINIDSESEKKRIKNAIDLYIICPQNRQVAYGR